MADGLVITEMAILVAPSLGAVLLTALYTRVATAALSSPCVGAPVTLRRAQSPCALCRGDRACFAGLQASLSLLAWSLAESWTTSEMPSRGEVPREARQAWRAWSLAKSSERVSWALAGRPVVPWFPLCRQKLRKTSQPNKLKRNLPKLR